MNRIIGFLFLCAFSATTCLAQNTTLSQAATEVSQSGTPIMTFESTEVDYGVIHQNAEPYREFRFTNTGDAPLVISNAKGSCGCTVPEWSREPVAPGESSVVKVRYATNRIGKFSKTVTLTTNDEDGQHLLRIKGEVLKPEQENAASPTPSNNN